MPKTFTPYEKILNTVELYDPDHRTICVGGAALALQFYELGWELAPDDVDVLAPQDYINQLNHRLITDRVEGNAWADPHFRYSQITVEGERSMSLLPNNDAKEKGIIKFQAFTTIRDDVHSASYSPTLPIETIDGIPCLDAGEVLLWKAQLMRITDREALRLSLKNPEIVKKLGDTASLLKKLYDKNERSLEPTHGKNCGCYTCFDT